MNDTAEMLRQQMEETKSQLSDKLESLEHQVTETVQSTGAAVGAVQDIVQSISHALDVRRQIDRHPWLVLGGSVVLGYLAAEFLMGATQKSERPLKPDTPPTPAGENAGHRNGKAGDVSAATSTAHEADHEPGRWDSSWRQLRSMAIGTLMGVVEGVVARAVPPMVDYLTGSQASDPTSRSDGAGKERTRPSRQESSEVERPEFIASASNVRSG